MSATAVKYPPLFFILLLLAACGSPAGPRPAQTSPLQPSGRAVPRATFTLDCAMTGGAEGYPVCATPDAPPAPDTPTPEGYPPPRGSSTKAPSAAAEDTPVAPKAIATAETAPTGEAATAAPAAAVQPIPYADCSRTPGLPGCAAQAVPLPARLAFLDGFAPRLIGLDLETGAGWQAPLSDETGWLEWAPDGSKLLAAMPDDLYLVFTAEGSQVETFTSEAAPNWLPGGQLALDGSVRDGDGWRASLVRARETRWDLVFKRDSVEERILPLDSLPADSFYELRAWIPGTQKVLLQTYTASGSALQSGGRLLVADTLAATVTPYEVSAPLDSAAFAFNPAQGTLLALLTSGGGGPEGGARLALLDFATNQIRYPLPEGVIPNELAWQPDGKQLAFTAGALAPNASEEARRAFPAPGIYLLDPQNGAVQPLVQSPPPAVDGWPHWSADGRTLLYARVLPQQDGSPGVEVRARQPETGLDWLLVQGLPAPATAAGRPAWNRVIAIGWK